MTVTVLERDADLGAQTQLGYVDCDVHLYPRNGGADFDPFLSERWRRHRRTIGGRARQAFIGTAQYPRMSPEVGMRVDAWPPGVILTMVVPVPWVLPELLKLATSRSPGCSFPPPGKPAGTKDTP